MLLNMEWYIRNMDILELLEKRVDSLVTEIGFLRQENAKLRKDTAGDGKALQAENSNLKLALARKQQTKAALSKRLEGMLARIDGLVQGKQ